MDDPRGVVGEVERILLVGLPPIEVGGVLAMAVVGRDPREDLLIWVLLAVDPHVTRYLRYVPEKAEASREEEGEAAAAVCKSRFR